MSDNEILSAGFINGLRHAGSLYGIDGEVARSHEALRAERDAFRVGDEIARRHADGWHPVFASDPEDSEWVPWNEGEPEPLTSEQYAWFQAAWADRHARKATRP